MTDYYGLLGLAQDATAAQIDEAYVRAREAALSDTAAAPCETTQRLGALQEAYAELSDPVRKALYDTLSAAAKAEPNPTVGQPLALVQMGDLPASLPDSPSVCPHCGASLPVQATICPACGRQASRPCPRCGQPVTLGVSECPRCQAYLPEYDRQRFVEAEAVVQRVEAEREEAGIRVATLEQGNVLKERLACLFWLIVAVLVVLLVALAVYLFGAHA